MESKRRVRMVIDVSAIAVSLVLAGFLVVGEDSSPDPLGTGAVSGVVDGVRAAVSLIFVLFVPGWAAVRAAGFGLESLTFVAAFVLSIAAMIVTSFLMATAFGWPWRLAGLAWTAVCAVGLVAIVRRDVVDAGPAR